MARTALALLSAALAGVLSALAFAPFSIPFAMVLGVAVLLGVLRRLSDAHLGLVAGVGVVYGAVFMGILIPWMRAVDPNAYLALVAAETVFLGIIAVALRAAARAPLWPVAVAAVWAAGETVRGTYPFSGFPWGRLAHSALETPLEGWVRWLGQPGLSALMALCAALVVVLVSSRSVLRSSAVAVTITGLALGGLLAPSGVAGPAGVRTIAAVQGDVPGEFLRWPTGEIARLHVAETRRLLDDVENGRVEQPDLVVWPESSVGGDPAEDPVLADQLDDLVDELDVPILLGGLIDGPDPETTAFNAAILWTADGPTDRYVKQILVPYGEYVPFRQQIGSLVPRFDRDIPRDMLPGEESGALPIDDAELVAGATICWDLAYDGLVRAAVADGAQVLFGQTSNAAFTGTAQPEQQWAIARMRARETGRWMVVPSTNGVSGVADAAGDVVARAPLHQPATLVTEVPLASDPTPAVRWGLPIHGTILAVAALAVLTGWRRRETG